MPIEPPTWATSQDVEEHGRVFLCLFTGRAHFENYLRTGDMRRPASVRQAAKLAADPVKVAREKLRRPVDNARRAIRDAEAKIADASPHLGSVWGGYKAELTITAQRARIAERQAALKAAEVDFELFDLQHPQ